jgi:hypothetical protein
MPDAYLPLVAAAATPDDHNATRNKQKTTKNNITGSLPEILGQNPLSRRLYVDHNRLHGTIPDSFDA